MKGSKYPSAALAVVFVASLVVVAGAADRVVTRSDTSFVAGGIVADSGDTVKAQVDGPLVEWVPVDATGAHSIEGNHITLFSMTALESSSRAADFSLRGS